MKERLVGAAVLVAAAVILIPEMLSGPRRQEPAGRVPTTSEEPPLKTYTIDLNQSPAATNASGANATDPGASVDSDTNSNSIVEAAPPAETAPPPVDSQPASETQTMPESVAAAIEPPTSGTTSTPVPAIVAEPTPTVAAVKPTPPPTSPAATQSAPPVSTAQASGGKNGWAVQLGSFASRETADRMMKDLRGKGHEAFVMPFKAGGSTLYRVRIGPTPDRESAADTLSKVKSIAPGATVVAHP